MLFTSEEEIKGTKEEITSYIIKELQEQLKGNYTDTENLADNLRHGADILQLIEENNDTDKIILKYNPFGEWYKAEEIEQDYVLEVERAYDEYLYNTENRGASYGELAYIESLNKQELDNLYNAATEESEAVEDVNR